MAEELNNVLKNCELFSGFDDSELDKILEQLEKKRKEYQKGETVYFEGETEYDVGVVARGEVKILRDDYNGTRSILASIGAGEIFAEAFVCAGAKSLPVSVVSGEKTLILHLKCRQMLLKNGDYSESESRILTNLLRVTAKKNLLLNRKIEVLSRKTIKDKLLSYLWSLSKNASDDIIIVPFDRQQLADYLGADRSALSAEIGKLVKSGVIECRKNKFKLLSKTHPQSEEI